MTIYNWNIDLLFWCYCPIYRLSRKYIIKYLFVFTPPSLKVTSHVENICQKNSKYLLRILFTKKCGILEILHNYLPNMFLANICFMCSIDYFLVKFKWIQLKFVWFVIYIYYFFRKITASTEKPVRPLNTPSAPIQRNIRPDTFDQNVWQKHWHAVRCGHSVDDHRRTLSGQRRSVLGHHAIPQQEVCSHFIFGLNLTTKLIYAYLSTNRKEGLDFEQQEMSRL